MCAGGQVVLTANLGNYNTDNLIYRWYTVEGANETEIAGATSRILTVNPSATTLYRVRVMQTTSECKAEGEMEIKVVTPLELTLTLTPDTNICQGGQITLTATEGDGVYSWMRNGVTIEGATTNTISESPLAVDGDSTAYNYGVVFTPEFAGCRSTMTDTLVYVFGNPTVVISGDPIICNVMAGDNVNLRANLNDDYMSEREKIYAARQKAADDGIPMAEYIHSPELVEKYQAMV